ncbi:MAG: minor capsid protein [Clostridiales bacterium]|nr:minor capsid protein [Clostridiales bacterium]
MANRYWRLREEQNRKQNIQDEKAYDREINSIYEQAFDEIQDEINSFYGKYARKEGISMAEAKKRVSRLDIEEYERKAARYVAEKNFSDKANEEMRLYNTTMKINRLEMLKSDIALRLTGAADRADKYSGKVLTEATRKELERQAGILGSTVHSWNTQAAEKIVKSPFRNSTYSERVWNNASTIQYDLEKELRRTLIQGKAMDFSRLGPFAKCQERAKADARRLLKTELVRCRSEAQKAEYEENGFDEYEFMCLGANPCEICQGLNGKHFPVRDLAKNMGEFAPPIHPNCRCTTAPWVDEDAYNNWLDAKTNNALGVRMNKYAPKLSGYATASKNEYLAESFVAYNKGELGKIDPEYSKAIRKLNGGNISNTSRNMKPVMVNYSTKNIPTLLLPKNEYAHVMSELNTNLTKEQLKQPVVLKAIGNYIYTVEINGFDDYRIIGKREIDI